MLSNLSPLELGRLRMSVGYGTHKKGRPLSPMEVGRLLDIAHNNSGISLEDCADALGLEGTSQVQRFLRILNLPQDLQHLVGWGSEKGSIGFSAAVELVRLEDDRDQRAVADAILTRRMNSKETQQVVQLRARSGRPIEECLDEILNMRPRIERQYIFIGSIVDQDMQNILGEKTQNERDLILKSGIEYLGLQNASGRMGRQFFTLSGDEGFDSSMKKIGKNNLEEQLRNHISAALGSA